MKMPDLSDSGPWDDLLDKLAKELFEEKIKKGTIDPALYKKTVEDLMKAMYEGLGGISFAIDDSRNTLKAFLEQNIYKFSAAKSLTELEHFRSMLTDENGKLRSFVDFRNTVIDAGYQFNVNWLKTEYNNAVASAQMAEKWQSLLDNGTEYLEYRTAGDERVRPAHAALDGLTLSINSPVWDRIYPPCDWNCRCDVIPGIAGNASSDETAGPLGKNNITNPVFEHNVGKDKIIFKDDHPYFKQVPKELDAVKNYGLPTVAKIYSDYTLPLRLEMSSEGNYRDWWHDQRKAHGTDDIILKDTSGLNILFDSVSTPGANDGATEYFKDHIIMKSAEERWTYAANFPDIVTAPDEVWSQRNGKKIYRYYIKYYEDAPYAVIVKDKGGKLIAETMYQLTRQRATELRRGVLIYSKK